MISVVTGNLFDSDAQALVNTVNTVGVMGKGIALQFKEAYPDNYRIYRKACKEGTFSVGQMLVTSVNDIYHQFPYKDRLAQAFRVSLYRERVGGT